MGLKSEKVSERVESAQHCMSRKRPARSGNPDLRRGLLVPDPPIVEIEAKLLYWLTPESFEPLSLTPRDQKVRSCLLTLPVIPLTRRKSGG